MATGVVSAILVDATRLIVYGTGLLSGHLTKSQELITPIVVGTICAFTGAFVGKQFLQRVTLRVVRATVAAAMLLIGLGLLVGFV